MCDSYIVTPGDTLRLVAERYYGARDLSPLIYDANVEVVGRNPDMVEIGTVLAIPCREGMSAVQPTAFLATPDTAENATPESNGGYFVAIAGAAPFVGDQGTGILPDLLAAALRSAGYGDQLEITRTEAITDILEIATPDGALLSFPWIKPDCAAPGLLSARSKNLCQNFAFTNPIYEITLGLFTRAGDPLVKAVSTDDLSGRFVCIPGFHSEDLLRRNAILEMDINITYVRGFSDCLDGFAEKGFDLILADYQSFATFAPEEAGLVDIPAFATKTTLHAIAPMQDPEALDIVDLVNAGLKDIMTSGAWFGIVKSYLAQQAG